MTSQSFDKPLPDAYPPRTIRILGAGRFGFIAAERLSRRHPEADFLVVDTRRDRLDEIERVLGLPVLEEDSIPYLRETAPDDDTWLIPAVPVHVAFHWLLDLLGRIGRARPIEVPRSADAQLPNAARTPDDGTIYTSFATFLCPDACNEPDDLCTHTGKAREGNLFERIGRVEVPGMKVIVVRSWQLAPGVGGYPAGYVRDRLREAFEREGRYLVATSCRCHGVVNALEWSRGRLDEQGEKAAP